ncbi:MAG: carboxypeptidase regulatory-like domain-containing protein, partial [Tepidisphaeraceae bacterium]
SIAAKNLKEVDFDLTRNSAVEIGRAFRKALYQAQFTMDLYDAPYPFSELSQPDISEARYKLGEEFFNQMQCLSCHYLGDPKAPGSVMDPKAPNLSLTASRLQRRWVRGWVQEPPVIQAGTSMPAFFSGLPVFSLSGQTWSEAAGRPAEEIEFYDKRYGETADAQAKLLLDFLYAAGARGVTVVQPPKESLPQAPAPTTRPAPAPATAPAPAPKQTKVAPEAESTAPAAAAPPAPAKPSIVGKIVFKGDPPQMPQIDMKTVADCHKQHPNPVFEESVVVDEKSGTMRNVIVYISAGLPEGQTYPPPKQAAVIHQEGCLYSPHVLAVQVGQPVIVTNADNFLHNVHSLAQSNPNFNFGQSLDKQGKTVEPFKVSENFKIKCDVHPWMGAYIQVFEHPYFSVTREDGTFSIANLPPGAYTITAWQEQLGERKKEVTVEPGKPTTVDLSFE